MDEILEIVIYSCVVLTISTVIYVIAGGDTNLILAGAIGAVFGYASKVWIG